MSGGIWHGGYCPAGICPGGICPGVFVRGVFVLIPINHTVNVNDVENAINKLKPGKSDGFDGITSDYLINASPLCFVYLSYLFTTMLYYCFTPKSLCNSTMIPIPKGSNKDTSDI